MTNKRRLQIYLEPHRYKQLCDASSKFGVSKSKIIAQALDKWFFGQGANRSRFITKPNGESIKES
jgi:hypothetical protein